MKRLLTVTPMVFLCCFTVGCQQNEEVARTPIEDVKAINKAIYEPHSSMIAAGDLEGWLANFSDDIIYMPGNMKTLRGKDAVRQWAQEGFDQYDVEETINIEEIKASGDLAFSLFTYSFKQTPKVGGEAEFYDGRIIQVLERQQDGSWKITRHISSSENPPEVSATNP